jgi:hypothetical protein
MDNVIEIAKRIIRLTEHPLFHEQTELPAWDSLVKDLAQAIDVLEQES